MFLSSGFNEKKGVMVQWNPYLLHKHADGLSICYKHNPDTKLNGCLVILRGKVLSFIQRMVKIEQIKNLTLQNLAYLLDCRFGEICQYQGFPKIPDKLMIK